MVACLQKQQVFAAPGQRALRPQPRFVEGADDEVGQLNAGPHIFPTGQPARSAQIGSIALGDLAAGKRVTTASDRPIAAVPAYGECPMPTA